MACCHGHIYTPRRCRLDAQCAGREAMDAAGGWFRPEYDNAYNYVHSIEVPALYFKGALALADNNINIHKCHPATVKSVYCAEYSAPLFDNIIGMLFHGVVLQFDSSDFRLRPLANAMLGAFIMYHPEILEEFGPKHPVIVEFYKVLKYFQIETTSLMQWSNESQSRRRAEACASSNDHKSTIEALTATTTQLRLQVAELLICKQEHEKVNRALIMNVATVMTKLDS